MLCNASSTTLTVLASEGFSDHACHTKVLLVEFPLLKKFANDCPLLIPASELGNIAGIFNHGIEIEVGRQAIEYDKKDVQKRSGGVRGYEAEP